MAIPNSTSSPNSSPSPLSDSRGEIWKKAFVDRMKNLNHPLEGIYIDFPIPHSYIHEALVELRGLGLVDQVEMIHLRSSDSALFDILRVVAPTLENLNIWGINYTDCQITLNEFFTRIPWRDLRGLKILKLSVRRFGDDDDYEKDIVNHHDKTIEHMESDPSSDDTVHPDPHKVNFNFDFQFDNPFLPEETNHLFNEFNLTILYPTTLTPDRFDQVFSNDMDTSNLREMAQALVNIVGLYRPPSVQISYRTHNEDEEQYVKGLMCSRKMNDALWDEIGRIREEYEGYQEEERTRLQRND
ncbi:uncharacterized protein I303_106580 [Kwoniella dejecticola CBS 10117]|uniref:Uncharacterized protein n=1 Tax=Kwoniella dejecticola CBS 10117 TaxID=1296121 RepID=A0A1A5ZUA5_9TREE|nr:uncharacterized protein I303_08163 [Kwoniella dejecticola CBS 10117]OBR81393.1 hypothetical protein I303_08163 [Kwoniella dejecticola CBS 10117]